MGKSSGVKKLILDREGIVEVFIGIIDVICFGFVMVGIMESRGDNDLFDDLYYGI